MFDTVVSFDVIEHVRNVSETIAECKRVLKPGGSLILVYPPFYCPTEHHLSMVTRSPAIHWLFDSATLYQAYREIIQERDDSDWYLPEGNTLQEWEALHTLNGTTVADFSEIVAAQGWGADEVSLPFWPATSGRVHRSPLLRNVWKPLQLVNKVPGIRELTTDRICAILTVP